MAFGVFIVVTMSRCSVLFVSNRLLFIFLFNVFFFFKISPFLSHLTFVEKPRTDVHFLLFSLSKIKKNMGAFIIGWYQGERMRDDQRGWFPGNYTVEIASSHVRARNLRQRYRLLALSGNFIEEQARRDKEESKRKSKKISVISLNE